MTRIKLTMRAAIACVLMWSLAFSGCSVPDDPGYNGIWERLFSAQAQEKRQLRRWTANRRAEGALSERDGKDKIVRTTCPDPDDGMVTFTITVGEVLQCLRQGAGVDMGNMTFEDCLDDIHTNHVGGRDGCIHEWAPGFEPDAVPQDWEWAGVDEDDVARGIVSSSEPPPKWVWAIIGLAAVTGVGIVVIGTGAGVVALCPLGIEWSCPSSPLYPPGGTPQPDQGGDR